MRNLGPLVAVLVIASSSCGSETPNNSLSGSQTTPVQPLVTRVFINGAPPALTAIDQTARLTASASYNDGTSGDVTTQATWVSSDRTLFTVSAGLVTVVNYGVATITAALSGRTSNAVQATATPPGTFIMNGRAREPGFSGIPGLRVLETLSNRSAMTNAAGEYQLAGLSQVRSLKFDKDGYENIEIVPADTGTQLVRYVEGALQRIVRLSAGQTLTALQIAPHDVAYEFGPDHCYPCKLVRVTTPGGKLRMTATWTRDAALSIWMAGQRFERTEKTVIAEAQVAPGETPVYIGWNLPTNSQGANDYAIFSLEADMVGS